MISKVCTVTIKTHIDVASEVFCECHIIVLLVLGKNARPIFKKGVITRGSRYIIPMATLLIVNTDIFTYILNDWFFYYNSFFFFITLRWFIVIFYEYSTGS